MIVQPSAMQRVAADVAGPAPKATALPPLHADDQAGQCAHKASQFGSVVQFNLMAAASPILTPAKRLDAMERVFTAWPMLCREMAKLAEAAPRCSAAGAENAARLSEIAERVGASV